MIPFPRFSFCSVLLSLALLVALAEGAPTAAPPDAKSLGKIQEVRVTGLKRYSAAEVLSVAGLAIGQAITEEDLKDAINVLGKTGAFSDLAYSYSTLAGTVKAEFQLAETDKLLAVRFDNFVWWPDNELRAKLRERVPLYRDQLPVSGTLPDSVADGLQALISERQLPGHVIYSRYAPENGPLEAFIYHVENIFVGVRSMDFPGAAPEELPALQDAARKQLLGKEYSASQLAIVAGLDFRNVYLRHGYLQVEFGPPTVTAPPAAKNESAQNESANEPTDDVNSVSVDVHLAVHPGLQFRMASVEWAGNHAFPAAELDKLITVLAGQIANLPQLQESLDQALKLYGTRGYLEAKYKLEPHLDSNAKTASFTAQITEGVVFRFGELSIDGLDTKTAARLRDQWSLRSGEPFNTGYEVDFLKEALRTLPPGRWSSVQNHLNEAEKTVDVELRYAAASN